MAKQIVIYHTILLFSLLVSAGGLYILNKEYGVLLAGISLIFVPVSNIISISYHQYRKGSK